ncbi:peptidoglycan-binding protein [Nodularia harveyana UHCC-0300]|uniref:Peptidoglycan-binding protein n=2 Tax=Nodularia harveyana TaxID=114805 RepID=A0ABU5UEY6_9CYAN|nr:peptidoglycan-binding protein [Nodularia harveyana]MEA5581739.1 peptidoglycan-binding protein [Nodularia harveyana UHCC-0300]
MSLEISQASSTISPVETVLIPGSQGQDVKGLQSKLKDLGYYNGDIDGMYGKDTQDAVVKFQKFRDLRRTDGVADMATRDILQTAWLGKNPVLAASASSISTTNQVQSSSTIATTDQPKSSRQEFIWWSVLGLGILGSLGALLFLLRLFAQLKNRSESPSKEATTSRRGEPDPRKPESENVSRPQENQVSVVSPQTPKTSLPTAVLPPDTTSRLSKLSVVDQLIQDLRSNDRSKRRKAIWRLGQQGDSRAIQPLVDLMINADSQQRSLILAALAEINARALRPMNRALAISLQDESPQVRQNAIRDLTRVYDMMTQMSQMLAHAAEDPDVDVQTTAKYALTQMNQMRLPPNKQSLPEDNNQQSKQRKL